MSWKLPALPVPAELGSLPKLAEALYRFGDHVLEYLRHLPTVEFKTITTVGHYPIAVETITARPLGVLRLRTYETDRPSVLTASTAIGWYPSDDPLQPGIIVTELGGIPSSPANAYPEQTVVLLVLGEREVTRGI